MNIKVFAQLVPRFNHYTPQTRDLDGMQCHEAHNKSDTTKAHFFRYINWDAISGGLFECSGVVRTHIQLPQYGIYFRLIRIVANQNICFIH